MRGAMRMGKKNVTAEIRTERDVCVYVCCVCISVTSFHFLCSFTNYFFCFFFPREIVIDFRMESEREIHMRCARIDATGKCNTLRGK